MSKSGRTHRTLQRPSAICKVSAASIVGVVLSVLLFSKVGLASPFISAGDSALRHDIQLLADYGVITGPTS
ncbi:MAG: hypothetical protein AAGD11_20535, partial [Planctomycetota bacterium]